MSIGKPQLKVFDTNTTVFDYDQELKEIWRSILLSLKSNVLCESCSQIDKIKQQIYLNKTRKKSSLLEAAILAKEVKEE